MRMFVTAQDERRLDEAARPDPCAHGGLEALGPGGRASYFRCGDCGRVFIEQDDRVWTLRRSVGA